MARNEEKHAGRLNRLWLQRLDEENAQKNPPRPGLGSLHTSEQVKKWMPSIKKDIDFYLKQSQVGCYPERKIAEFSEKIEGLTKEYKAYLRKYRDLEGTRDSTPWSDQPYCRKHKTTKEPDTDSEILEEPPEKLARRSESLEKSEDAAFVPLSLPVLEQDDSYTDIYTYNIVNTAVPAVTDPEVEANNQPLEFNWNKNVKALEYQTDIEKDCPSNQMQDEPLNFQWRKKDLIGCSKCSDECPRDLTGRLKCSSECSDSLCKCPKNFHKFPKSLCKYPMNLCKCPENLGSCHKSFSCIDAVNDNSSHDRDINCSNSTEQHTVSTTACVENENVLNSISTSVPESLMKDKTMNKDTGNILNLPYSDSSSDDDS